MTSILKFVDKNGPRGLRRGSAAHRLLGLRVRIPPWAWMSVSCECCQVHISLSRGDRLSRGFLQSVVYLSVIVKPQQREGPDPLGPVQIGKRSVLKSMNLLIMLFSSSSCRFLLLLADINLISLLSHTLNPCVLHLHETTIQQKVTCKMTLLCKLILMFSDRERVTKDSELNSGKPSPKLTDSYFLFLLCLDFTVTTRYLNFVMFPHDLLSIKRKKNLRSYKTTYFSIVFYLQTLGYFTVA